MLAVSIHAPARGATFLFAEESIRIPCFNPRTREGCDTGRATKRWEAACFNPRTREGCDENVHEEADFDYLVSIHAPARGATPEMTIDLSIFDVSIHAPARGATALVDFLIYQVFVSIHAPARGAT